MPPKRLYKIGHLTRVLGITPRTVRFYDQYGLMPHVKRSEGRVRLFDDEDIEIIRKVRKLQQTEGLQLDEIKRRLFGTKSQGKKEYVVLTDSFSGLSQEMADRLGIGLVTCKTQLGKAVKPDNQISAQKLLDQATKENVSPEIQAPEIEELVSHYRALATKGFKRIYSVHPSSQFSESAKQAELAASKVKDIDVRIIEVQPSVMGASLFSQLLLEAIQNGSSQEELNLLISKNCHMANDLVVPDSARFLFQRVMGEALPQSPRGILADRAQSVRPVLWFHNRAGSPELMSCPRTKAEAIEVILALFEQEVADRGGYLKKLCVYYAGKSTDADAVLEKIQENHPKSTGYVEQMSGSLASLFGPDALAISFI